MLSWIVGHIVALLLDFEKYTEFKVASLVHIPPAVYREFSFVYTHPAFGVSCCFNDYYSDLGEMKSQYSIDVNFSEK